MEPNITAGVLDLAARNDDCPMEEPDIQIAAKHSHCAISQPQRNDLDESDPEVASESDGDEEIFFKPGPPCPSPSVIKRTLRELGDLMNTQYLDLDSAEHRPRNCDDTDRLTEVIDSLLQNYDFPPIFFNVKQVRGPDGSIQYNRICIDGLKRLYSIKAFMGGNIPCHDDRRRKWYYRSNAAKGLGTQPHSGRRYLSDDAKEAFDNKYFTCLEFEDLSAVEHIELRTRVHLGSTFAPGEKLRATIIFSGDLVMNFAKTLQNDFQLIADLGDTRRLKGFHNLMKCSAQILEVQRAIARHREPVLRISESALNSFVQHATASTLKTIKETLSVFCMVVQTHPEEFSQISGVPFSSMEMITISVLTFKYYNSKIKPFVFIRLIGALRQSLHKFSNQKSVLQTHQNWQHAWNCIRGFDRFVAESDIRALSSAMEQEMQRTASKDGKKYEALIRGKPVALENEQLGGSRASSATLTSFSHQNSTLKRKGSPQHSDPAKKRIHLSTPVSPAIMQSPALLQRDVSPDSVLGSDGSESEQVTEGSRKTILKAATIAPETDKSISPEPAPRQLVRSSFKRISDFVPRPSKPPKPPTSISTLNIAKSKLPALGVQITSVPSPRLLEAESLSPAGLIHQLGTSEEAAVKAPLPHSHETKKTIPDQASRTLATAWLPSIQDSEGIDSAADVEERLRSRSPFINTPSHSGNKSVTPLQQSPISGRGEALTMPLYSGRGRPRKYPPKPPHPEGQAPRPRGRPRKIPDIPNPGPPRQQAYGIRGRPRKNIPGGVSTRTTSISISPSLQQKPNDHPLQASNTPGQSQTLSTFGDHRGKNMSHSSPLSTKSPSSALQEPKLTANGNGGQHPPSDVTPHSINPEAEKHKGTLQVDQTPESVSSNLSLSIGNAHLEEPLQTLFPHAQKASPASVPPESATLPMKPTPALLSTTNISAQRTESSTEGTLVMSAGKPSPTASAIAQSKSMSVPSSSEPSASLMSPVVSATIATPRATPDPALVDAKPFIAPFKVGGAKAIAERRRQEHLQLQERKKKLQSEKLAAPAVESHKPKG